MKKCTVWTNPLFCRKIHLQDVFWSDCFDFWFIRQAHLWSGRGRAQEFNIKSLNLSICRLEHVVCIWFRHQSLKTAAAGHWAEMWKSQRPKQQTKRGSKLCFTASHYTTAVWSLFNINILICTALIKRDTHVFICCHGLIKVYTLTYFIIHF